MELVVTAERAGKGDACLLHQLYCVDLNGLFRHGKSYGASQQSGPRGQTGSGCK